jgi:photosystem II stability/assembly factor-like uncharacterized protein
MRRLGLLLLTCAISSLPTRAAAEENGWFVLASGVDTNLRGISADFARPADHSKVQGFVIWVCGSNGVILRSADEGQTWKRLHVQGSEDADFRGIRSFGSLTAYVMSVGEGGKSHIYKTTDGGESWHLQYSDQRREFFLDALVCRSERDCFALSDPVAGKFLLLHTGDGEHWNELPRESMPPAVKNEGVFAASNSAMAICGSNKQQLFFGTGGPVARVFRSLDSGQSWKVVTTPIASGNISSGIFSVQCSGEIVVAVGGDYRNTSSAAGVAAYSVDGGLTWLLAESPPGGFRSGVAITGGSNWVAVGPSGEDDCRILEADSAHPGAYWKRVASLNLNAVFMLDERGIFATGPKGMVARYEPWVESK